MQNFQNTDAVGSSDWTCMALNYGCEFSDSISFGSIVCQEPDGGKQISLARWEKGFASERRAGQVCNTLARLEREESFENLVEDFLREVRDIHLERHRPTVRCKAGRSFWSCRCLGCLVVHCPTELLYSRPLHFHHTSIHEMPSLVCNF